MPRLPRITAKALREELKRLGPAAPERSYYIMEWANDPDSVRGFGVRVFHSHASYVVRWRGKTHHIADTSHLAPEEARREARALLQRLQGFAIGPAPGAATVDALLDRYLSDWSKTRKAAKSQKQDARYAAEAKAERVRVSPRGLAAVRFGALDVRAVEGHHIAEMHAARSNRPFAANRLMGFLSHVFEMAEKWGLRPRNTNPTADVEPYDEPGRERVFTRAEWQRIGEELPKLYDVAPAAQVLALYAIAYTGARPGEVAAWELSWLNRDLCAVVQPRHKGNRRGQRQKSKIVFLTDVLFRSLLALERRDGERYVFPGRVKNTHIEPGIRAAWGPLKERARLVGATLTTFRHSIQTEMPEAGIPVQYTPGLAGHSSVETGQRHYMHASDGVLRQAADTLHGHVSGLLGGTQPRSRRRAVPKATPRPRRADSGS